MTYIHTYIHTTRIEINALNTLHYGQAIFEGMKAFYVDETNGYIQAEKYGEGTFSTLTGSENQPKTTPAFGDNGKVVENASSALKGICEWVKNMSEYQRISRNL